MDASIVLRDARSRAGLTLRELAGRADTSHSTLAAYESGSKTPNVCTLDRVLRAAGFESDVSLADQAITRGEELAAVLDLAAAFPAERARRLAYPVFGMRDLGP